MSRPNAPQIISPNGGETYNDQDILVIWQAPKLTDPRGLMYKIYFTDNFDPQQEPDWRQLAVLPSVVRQFSWRAKTGIRSDKCRIALRAINDRGEQSEFLISASNFTINKKKLTAPFVIYPISGQRYNKYINIQVDDSGILGTTSQRAYYQFFYRCDSLGIPKTPIAQDIPVGSDPVFWNIIDLNTADDYVLESYLEDDDGNTSTHSFTTFSIVNEGYFILDTTPPESAIIVNNNSIFTKDRPVSVEIVSYDAATAVHSMRLQEDGGITGQPNSIGSVRSFYLSEDDGVKVVELLLQDFGGNRNNDTIRRLFEVLVEITGVEIVDIALDVVNNILWAITGGSGKYLYRVTQFPSRKTTFSDTPTALGVFQQQPYIGIVDSNNKGTLIKYSTLQEVVISFSENDSVINALASYGLLLYVGLENGSIYSFDGVNYSFVQTLDKPIKSLVSDGNLLYATLKNELDIYVYNGTSFISTGA